MWDNPLTYLAIIGVVAGVLGILFRIGVWVGSVNTRLSSFEAFRDTVYGKLDSIIAVLGPSAVTPGSPLKLTELGRSISERLDAETWAYNTTRDLHDRVAEAGFSETFEFHEMAEAFVKKEFEPDAGFLRKMRDCAYEKGISLEQVQNVLIVVLRDALLDAEGRHGRD